MLAATKWPWYGGDTVANNNMNHVNLGECGASYYHYCLLYGIIITVIITKLN